MDKLTKLIISVVFLALLPLVGFPATQLDATRNVYYTANGVPSAYGWWDYNMTTASGTGNSGPYGFGDVEMRWEESDASVFTNEGSQSRLSSGVRRNRRFEFSFVKYVQSATGYTWVVPMNATQTIPIPVRGSSKAKINIICATVNAATGPLAFNANTDITDSAPSLEFWGTNMGDPEFVNHVGDIGLTSSTSTIKCSTRKGWYHLPVTLAAVNTGLNYDADMNAGYSSPYNVIYGASQGTFAAIAARPQIRFITTEGLYEVDTTGLTNIRVNTKYIYDVTVACIIELEE